jgi:hypothetical protein
MATKENKRLGLSEAELSASPYAGYWHPELAPLRKDVVQALARGARACELLGPIEDAPSLLVNGYLPIETGYTLTRGGGARLACLTPMPGVAPAMWDWWFGWHGSESARYKLWHPKAHVSADWADGQGFTGGYVGRTSRVTEYFGEATANLAIRFVPPSEFGLDEEQLAARGELAICARAGPDGAPVQAGALIHHIRPVPGGCEMRSRFWIYGENLRVVGLPGPISQLAAKAARLFAPADARQAELLLVHCAEEMAHLSAFLPELYAEFGDVR